MSREPAGRSRSRESPAQPSPDELCSLIPHGGEMCLLERVEAWDDESILCSTDSHQDPDNPLRCSGRLSVLQGLEYGAQAMAVHGALLARREGVPMPSGYVAAVHDLRTHVDYLDSIEARLYVEARRLIVVLGNLVYNVVIEAGGQSLLEARVTVVQRSGARP